jgi:hypothetical protein
MTHALSSSNRSEKAPAAPWQTIVLSYFLVPCHDRNQSQPQSCKHAVISIAASQVASCLRSTGNNLFYCSKFASQHSVLAGRLSVTTLDLP